MFNLIEMLTDDVADATRRLEEYQNHAYALQKAVDSMYKALGDQLISVHPTHSLDFSISGNKDTLVTAFRVLTKRGWAMPNNPPEAGVPFWSGFMYRRVEDNIPAVWVNFSSTVCRQIKVGTELREVEIYETVCDDGAE